jgi:tetratricopeptide (TPR) repeat protein
VLRGSTQIAQGFESVGNTETPGVEFQRERSGAGNPHAYDLVRSGDDITRNGVHFLRRNRDQRFFLWLHYFDAHNPYLPPTSLARRFPNDPYLAEVAATDAQIGRLVAELEQLGLRERTLLVVTSDHGEGLGEHGEPTHSYFVYDTTMRVPLVMSGPPELPRGRRVEAVTRSIDVAPTILDYLGLPPLPQADGTSLRPWIEDIAPASGLQAYGESVDLYSVFGTTPLRLLRAGRWKYIHKVSPELYDVPADPHELTNLASEHPEIVAELRAQLEALLAGLEPPPTGAALEVDDATRASLESLGYLAAADGSALPPERSLLEFTGSDPTLYAGDLALIATTNAALSAGRYTRALENLEGLESRHPGRGHFARLTGEALFGLDRMPDAVGAFERAVEREPNNDTNLRGLVRALEAAERTEDALRYLTGFAERHPCSRVRNQLARRLHSLERHEEQLGVLAAGVDLCPETPGLLNDYAWVLATSPVEELRDGMRAVALAERAIASLEGAAGANELDTLAAAHAEAGGFEAAVDVARRAVASLEARGAPPDSVTAYRDRVEAFERGVPVRY